MNSGPWDTANAIMSLDELGHLSGDPAEAAKGFDLSSFKQSTRIQGRGEYVLANNLVDHEFRVIASLQYE